MWRMAGLAHTQETSFGTLDDRTEHLLLKCNPFAMLNDGFEPKKRRTTFLASCDSVQKTCHQALHEIASSNLSTSH